MSNKIADKTTANAIKRTIFGFGMFVAEHTHAKLLLKWWESFVLQFGKSQQ